MPPANQQGELVTNYAIRFEGRDEATEVLSPAGHSKLIVRHFEEAGNDYKIWSSGFNMHFGFWRKGLNPFRREPMLEEATHQVLNRLLPSGSSAGQVLDLGCGVGASMLTAAKRFPDRRFRGVTLVPSQATMGNARLSAGGVADRATIVKADFHELPFESGSMEGCYGIESVVYAEGDDKRRVLAEMYRVLRPGGRFVVYDCFRIKPEQEFSWLTRRIYKECCRGWAVSSFAETARFLAAARQVGFVDLTCQDISWRIAPCAAHTPFVSCWFLMKSLMAGDRLSSVRRQHVVSSVMALLLGMTRGNIQYLIVSGTKPEHRSAQRTSAEPNVFSHAKCGMGQPKSGRFAD